ncbi:MAG TPA: hypothetical protein VFH83_04510 [Spirochaetia bacterium]|nr:hypothetical protein [Spirochaetia bacterium]
MTKRAGSSVANRTGDPLPLDNSYLIQVARNTLETIKSYVDKIGIHIADQRPVHDNEVILGEIGSAPPTPVSARPMPPCRPQRGDASLSAASARSSAAILSAGVGCE